MIDLLSNSRLKNDMTDMQDNVSGKVSSTNREYYFVGVIYNGEPVVLGAFSSYEQAQQEGALKLPVPFKIYTRSYKDMNKATKSIRYDLLESSNADEAFKRARHILPGDDYNEEEY